MALHNPVLEAAARMRHSLSDRHVTLDFCRRWCADNKPKALKAVEIAASQVDDLRAWSQIPAAAYRPPIEAAVIPGIQNTLAFLATTARDLRACHLPHLAADYDKARQLIEQFSGIPTPSRLGDPARETKNG